MSEKSMDSHVNKNFYPLSTHKTDEIYGGYPKTGSCDEQVHNQRTQHFLPPYAMSMGNNMSQQLMYNAQGQSMYNIMYGPQSVYRNQNSFTGTSGLNSFPQPMDTVPWVSETCMTSPTKEKFVKYNEKVKGNIDCCTNRVDNLTCSVLPDVYKNVNKDLYYNKIDAQWFYGNYDNQKFNDLPSCSQITENGVIDSYNIKDKNSPVKYCSIQKLPERDPKLYVYPNKYEHSYQHYNKVKEYPSCSQLSQTCNLYSGSTCLEIDKKILSEHCGVQNACDLINTGSNPNFYEQPNNTCENVIPFDVPKLDKTDDSNGGGGESDIVVEDSEDEVTDESEDADKELQPCLLCNVAIENHYYVVTAENTITSFSRTKVTDKIFQILGSLPNHSVNLCGTCMTLVNTVDNLEIQLQSIRRELSNKYLATVKSLKSFLEKSDDKDVDVLKLDRGTETKQKSTKYKFRNACSHSFKCRVCDKTFSLEKFHKYHMSRHKIKKNKSYLCEQCGIHFNKRATFTDHLRQHQPNKCSVCKVDIAVGSLHVCEKKVKRCYVCHICGKIFKSRTYLREHENSCSGNLRFECKACEKRFACSTKLKNHIKLEHDRVFNEVCSICSKGFVKHSNFKAHLLTHSAEKKFKCSICEKSYKTLSNLNQHVKVHSKKLPFTCNVCQKGFLRRDNLEAHVNFHNGIKPFACTLCDKKFGLQKNLDAHLRVHNGTIKKKTCTICSKQISHGMTEHMRTHSDLKCFSCAHCSMKFSTKGALSKHRKRKHPDKECSI